MPQSPELAGGTGFTFENLVAARYLTALLTETSVPGVGGTVTAVAMQQRDFGHPLDDVVVHFRTSSGAAGCLNLQCKKSLVVSAAKTNADFREIVRDSLKTLGQPGFSEDRDRCGAAVQAIAAGAFDTMNALCELARHSETLEHFQARVREEGNTSAGQRAMLDDVAALVGENAGEAGDQALVFRFLRHFLLIRFDYLHEGAADHAEGINSVRPALPAADAANAPLLWLAMCQIAREATGRSPLFSRQQLVNRLDRVVRLAGAPSFRADLDKVAALSRQWIRDIDDDVRGTRLDRAPLLAELERALQESRFVQVRGLPGSGKSVLLRRRVEQEQGAGPVLFLKSDRLEGRSWASFATAIGLTSTDVSQLLVEIAATGSSTFYLDGIDRVEKQHQGVVSDIVRAILSDPLLAQWKIVISMRDAGSEPVRTWLPDLFDKGRLATVDVRSLDDDEAETLALARPELRSVLFGADAVRQIVRRPFFAKILSQAFVGALEDGIFAPASEVDLIENWWLRGGFDASGSDALARQRALAELSTLRALHPGGPIGLAALSPGTLGQIPGFKADGILQDARKGHSIRFSHDIFFEWSLFNRMAGETDGWLQVLRELGEPPVIGRVVELLSQADYFSDRSWEATLSELEVADLRTQWVRAWLLGPIGDPRFDSQASRYWTICATEECRFLRKVLVWFQAEKTIPNAYILDGRLGSADLGRLEIVRLADALGWPSDPLAWRRLVVLVLRHLQEIPRGMIPDVVVLFEVWQNAVGALANSISSTILRQSATWLEEIESYRHLDYRHLDLADASPWHRFDEDLESLENSLRALLLRGAAIEPELVRGYIGAVTADRRRLDAVFKRIVAFSPLLAASHAADLVELALTHFRNELPGDRAARLREERRQGAERRRAALEKPEGERTREDELVLASGFSMLGESIGYHDWEDLAVDRDTFDYFPASPLRQPFHALFEDAPYEGLRLVKGLTRHAMAAWRQLHELDREGKGTPIPIALEFPWGRQEFWGAGHEYLWARGLWAPKPLSGAYLAMEAWALGQVDAGREVDDVIREVLEGNDSVGVLGIAVALFLKSGATTEATLPLITEPRLWEYDLARFVEEVSIRSSTLIGFHHRGDAPHALAVQAGNELPFRRHWIRDYLVLFLMKAEPALAERARAAITAFPDNLPFALEEERNYPEWVAELRRKAEFNAEFGNPENLQVRQDPDNAERAVVVIDNPLVQDVDRQASLARNLADASTRSMWFWAKESIEGHALESGIAAADAVAFARGANSVGLFDGRPGDTTDSDMLRGAVASIAAVVLKYRNLFTSAEVSWARGIIHAAAAMPEPPTDRRSLRSDIPWHPGLGAVAGLAVEVRTAPDDDAAKRSLLRIVAHPRKKVSLAALAAAQELSDIDPRLAWCALRATVTLCIVRSGRTYEEDEAVAGARASSERERLAEEAIELFARSGHWPPLPPLPPAWTSDEAGSDDDDELVAVVEEAGTRHRWRTPSQVLDWDLAADILPCLALDQILARAESRDDFLLFSARLRQWITDRLSPPWKDDRRREGNRVGRLDDAIGKLFARIAVHIPTAELRELFLDPVFGLSDDDCYEFLDPFVDLYVRMSVLDAPVIPANAVELLGLCVGRFLLDPSFDATRRRSARRGGHHSHGLLRSFFLISVESASLASRFANGDWTDVGTMMPLIEPLVRAGGWSADVMQDYLTLVERSRAHYPAESFADQTLSVLTLGRPRLRKWQGSTLPARIAGAVQHLAQRETPMSRALAQKFLRILDVLVDMGDRRSAALQVSDSFRDVRRPGIV